jgi:hypothetical protein
VVNCLFAWLVGPTMRKHLAGGHPTGSGHLEESDMLLLATRLCTMCLCMVVVVATGAVAITAAASGPAQEAVGTLPGLQDTGAT